MREETAPKNPSYRLHKPSGQAVVSIKDRDHDLGRHGSAASRQAYDRLIGKGNSRSGFHRAVTRLWRKWLGRRVREEPIPWTRFQGLLERHPLPRPVIVHAVYHGAVNP